MGKVRHRNVSDLPETPVGWNQESPNSASSLHPRLLSFQYLGLEEEGGIFTSVATFMNHQDIEADAG